MKIFKILAILISIFMLFFSSSIYAQNDLDLSGAVAPPHDPPPEPNSPSSQQYIDNGDGTWTFTQQIDEASTPPHYLDPVIYGFEIYSWFDQDYGWMHEFSNYNDPNLNILSAKLTIHAWDVDSEISHGYNGEYDGIHVDGNLLSPGYLQGFNQTWSTTVFDIPVNNITDDGYINVWMDIDMHHDVRWWATTLDYSRLEITYSTIQNDPPYQPVLELLPSDVCAGVNDDLIVLVTGPDPADPDGDAVSYLYRWFVDPGTGEFVDDEFAGRGDHTGNTVPAADTEIDDIWRVQVIPVDEHNAIGQLAIATFAQITQCGCNMPPVLTADQSSITVDEGQTATNTGTVSDPDGDVVTLTASIGTVTNNGGGTWSWSFTTSDGPAESVSAVIITGDDGKGGTAMVAFELNVNNVSPTVNTITIPLDPISISDQPVSVDATFSDPANTNDEEYTCDIDFGDASGPHTGTVSGTNCNGSHTYDSPGVYAVTVTVTDKDGGSGSLSTTEYIVIYDPADGFVTGGGWIYSPAGAYPADLLVEGKATFGFVSKYKKGSSTPDGNTQFNFRIADLKFHSISYDWLVIAGPHAKYKGLGTINGSGEYKFMLTAVDGQVNGGGDIDKFRIKIWEEDEFEIEVVIYDNQLGDPDDAEATDAIEGGSIQIHKSGSKDKLAKEISDLVSVAVPEDYSLEKIYPNPFNPSTTIQYALPEESMVEISIYNALGQKIITLINTYQAAGSYSLQWQPQGLSSGFYIVSFNAGEYRSIGKVLYVR